MDKLRPKKPLNLERFLLQIWKSWKQDFILFIADIKYCET